ncbi:hypothetical protein GW17_00014945 [Ensete ventricosum]|nr:hypothetical protein GW17_00014945 [Ensete ventricosum]
MWATSSLQCLTRCQSPTVRDIMLVIGALQANHVSDGTLKAARRRGGQPYAGPVTHGQAATKCCQGQPERGGSRPRALPIGLARKAAVARGHSRLQHGACKGGRLQGTRKGLPPVGAAAPAAGVATPWQCGCQWARAIVACAGATAAAATQRGKEGLGHPFEKRTILPI